MASMGRSHTDQPLPDRGDNPDRETAIGELVKALYDALRAPATREEREARAMESARRGRHADSSKLSGHDLPSDLHGSGN